MKIIEYNDPKTFLKLLENNFSSPYENELMIGLVSALLQNPTYYNTTPILASISEHNQHIFVFFLTPPWPILLYGQKKIDSDIITKIITFFDEKNISLNGINARKDISALFAQQWEKEKKGIAKETINMNVYVLQKIQTIQPCSGKMIEAKQHHFELIYNWAQRFHEEMHLHYESNEYLIRHVQHMIDSKNAFLWNVNEPVCMTFRERAHHQGFSIGYVYTPKENRTQGYATNLVHQVCMQSLKQGFHYSVLFADMNDPIANHVYQNIGFKEVCKYKLFDFGY